IRDRVLTGFQTCALPILSSLPERLTAFQEQHSFFKRLRTVLFIFLNVINPCCRSVFFVGTKYRSVFFYVKEHFFFVTELIHFSFVQPALACDSSGKFIFRGSICHGLLHGQRCLFFFRRSPCRRFLLLKSVWLTVISGLILLLAACLTRRGRRLMTYRLPARLILRGLSARPFCLRSLDLLQIDLFLIRLPRLSPENKSDYRKNQNQRIDCKPCKQLQIT